MRSFFATLRQLVLPAGALPGSARIVLGPDLPPPLDSYLFFGTTKAGGGIIFYAGTSSDASYTFIVFVNFGAVFSVHVGHVLTGTMLEKSTGVPAGLRISFQGSGFNFVQLYLTPIFAAWDIDGVSQPRGLAVDNANLPVFVSDNVGLAATAVEAVYLTAANVVYKAGRCYRMTWNYHARPAGACASVLFRMRRINIAGGAYIQDMNVPCTVASADSSGTLVRYIRNTTNADITQTEVFTVQPNAGTVQMIGTASIVGSWEIEDCGNAFDYPGVNVLV